MTVSITIPAKVNLQLLVGDVRPDGYHELATIFHGIQLFDQVQVSQASARQLTVGGRFTAGVPTDQTNLAWRAAQVLGERLGLAEAEQAVAIHLSKDIPVAGGMAGGSADCAATLVACARLWHESGLLSDSAVSAALLEQIAAELGSDIPFMLRGGTAIGRGRGELLESIPRHTPLHWVIGTAPGGLSTPAVFAKLDEMRAAGQVPDRPELVIDADTIRAVTSGGPHEVAALMVNDLQAPAVALAPDLATALDAAEAAGALRAMVSGSGPTVVALADSAAAAERIRTVWATLPSIADAVATQSPAEGPLGPHYRTGESWLTS